MSETDISEEDLLRADVYRLLAELLRTAPGDDSLAMFANMRGDATPLGRAIADLAMIADKSSGATVDLEYHALFIGTDGGEVSPYGSSYLSDFLHESPLERLRSDMSRAGIGVREDVDESEDHIAAICEMMAGMILGDFSGPVSLEEQRTFFKSHIAGWAPKFFADLQRARSSVFYAAVGELGAAFLDIEDAAFEMM